ncbi:LysR family transcriptional regulator [Bifidobacterium angulatum]|uniref:LysR family transcriptional regulator n=1 Tax=Bifidobacterium angulatum TaxID=1683 RepID=UPI002E77209A|nr:LysR family transcriptional regulator [Bifidobacterium angulatum]MEE0332791.1 LysR family transcriptional regulator [Bifidobacterium angulatum]
MERLNPQTLVTLWTIEQLGSFSAAARDMGWSQPAISQQIRKCETELGVSLVHRTSHGVELTPAGRILARHGQLIENRLAQAGKDLEEYRRNGSTHIRLVAPPSVCSSFVARVLVHISKSTDIRVSLMQMEPPEAVKALHQGLADCAITFRYNSMPGMDDSADLNTECFGIDPLMLMVGASSSIAATYRRTQEPVNLSEACDESWIAGCETCQANLVSLAKAAGFSPNITHSTDDYWATQNLVEVGMGVSIVPRLATMAGLRGDLAACPIRDANAFRQVCFVARNGDDRPAIAQVRREIGKASRQYLEPVC